MDEQFQLTVSASKARLADLTEAINAFMAPLSLPDRAVYAANLAVEELAYNAMAHGYSAPPAKEITVRLCVSDKGLLLYIEDDGRPFNPLQTPEPDLDVPLLARRIGGLGIRLVRRMCDGMEYAREENKNIVTVRISGRRAGDTA